MFVVLFGAMSLGLTLQADAANAPALPEATSSAVGPHIGDSHGRADAGAYRRADARRDSLPHSGTDRCHRRRPCDDSCADRCTDCGDGRDALADRRSDRRACGDADPIGDSDCDSDAGPHGDTDCDGHADPIGGAYSD
ncbi:MAG: hypothetical protein DWI58_06815 [Chloroflexi bacterium]|nr:MAG: hypothetical protein DWI58_06815 [Chloroflexota bacterium]